MGLQNVLVFITFVSCVLSYSGEFIPKSYYIIDHHGHKSDVVYFRSKRAVELFPLLRMKRGGGSSASSHSSATASSSSSSGSGGGGGGGGGGGVPLYQGGNDYNPGIIDPAFGQDFFNFGGGGGSGGHSHSFASASSSSSSGVPGQGGSGGIDGQGYNGPILFSRFGEDTGTGVKVSGSAKGQKGAFSSSSSSINGDGKITYSVKSGKY
jgi:hypothetical protein